MLLVIAWISDVKAMRFRNNTVPCHCQAVIGQEFSACKFLLYDFSQICCWEEQNYNWSQNITASIQEKGRN
jgi:hypothetical protein